MCAGNDFLYFTTELRVPSLLTVGSCKIKINSHSFLLQEENTRAQTESNQSKPKSSNATCSLSHRLSLAPAPHLLLSLVVLPQCWHLHYAASSLQLSRQLHQQPPLVSHSLSFSPFQSCIFYVVPNHVGYLHIYQVLLPT